MKNIVENSIAIYKKSLKQTAKAVQ